MKSAPPLDLSYLLRFDFWAKVDKRGPSDCWPWLRSVGNHGYGQVKDSHSSRLAHRCAYELTRGRIPRGLTVDHICHNRLCCNPAHLRALANVANASDNGFAAQTHCKRGHEFTPENTRWGRGRHGMQRWCRACELIHRERRKARRSGNPVIFD